jgi:phosphoglycolate phosphatase-like HAD superfamily hydrolase
MIKSQKNTLKKNKIIFFDVDGVLINSLKNMNISWNSCMKKFGIIKNFSKYSVLIGLPFEDILSNLNIKNNKKLIKEHYGKTSKKNINKITLYPKVKESLNKLSKHYQLGIVTSKSKGRTFFFLKKFKLIKYFKYISCPVRIIQK